LTLRIIESTAPTATLHLKASVYGERFFRRYGKLLHRNRRVYYRFADAKINFADKAFFLGYSFGFISDAIQDLDLIITDNETIGRRDQARFGAEEGKWRALYTRCDLDIEPPAVAPEGKRLLWASRLDVEKRPDLLLKIAQAYAQYLPDISIEVFGRPVLDVFDVAAFEGLPNIRYGGEFTSFAALRPTQYHGFLYTTAYDGLPNVVLEALAAGLPVIAPDIGGLGEAVVDGETGILIGDDPDDEVMLERYVTAAARLFASEDVRAQMGRNARWRIETRHAKAAFLDQLRDLFGERA
jgi:glycosyltransferase involved in cell wall biosynthesis